MSRMRSLIRADKRKELDRNQWAGLAKLSFEQTVSGAGEYLLPESIYFGEAFDAPPFFTFSVVADQLAAFDQVVTDIGPHESIGGSDGMGDSLTHYGLVTDPYFNGQARFDTYIPSITQAETWEIGTSGVGHYQKIGVETGGGSYPKFYSYMNTYIQGEPFIQNQARWELSTERPYPKQADLRSNTHSARYVFDSHPTSRWFASIPSQVWLPWQGIVFTPSDSEELWWQDVYSFVLPANPSYQGTKIRPACGGWLPFAFNPPLGKITVEYALWSDGPCQLEVNTVQWNDAGSEPPLYRQEIQNDTTLIDIAPSTWVTHVVDVIQPKNQWPNYPPDPEVKSATDYEFVLARARIRNGVPGQKAFIGRVRAWADLTTRGDNPYVTIGVSEWVRDEKGMYVGAYLWYKVGGLEAITVGDCPEPCLDSYYPTFPSIEQIVAANGLGPAGNEVPTPLAWETEGYPIAFSNGAVVPMPTYFHATNYWSGITVRTADPPPGSTHYLEWDTHPLPVNGVGVGFANDFFCGAETTPYFSVIGPGQTLTISWYGKYAGTPTTPWLMTNARFVSSALSTVSSPTTVTNLTTSWVRYTQTYIAPSTAYAVIISISSGQVLSVSSMRHRLGGLTITIT